MSAQHRSILSMSMSIGFSQSTFFPARTERRMRSVWVAVVDAIRTASTLRSSRIVSASPVGAAPYCAATSRAAASTGS